MCTKQTHLKSSAKLIIRGDYFDTPKNATSARPLKLSHSAFVLLREVQDWQDEQRALLGDGWRNKDALVFVREDGACMHPHALTQWFSEFAKRNGFTEGLHIHSLRHTYASLMIADGTPVVIVSKRMGHAQVSTTTNIYAHMISSADEKAAQISEKFADIVQLQTSRKSGESAVESAS